MYYSFIAVKDISILSIFSARKNEKKMSMQKNKFILLSF